MALGREAEAASPAWQTAAWDARLARVVSAVFSPPLMILAAVWLAARASAAWSWAAAYVAVAVLTPLVYVIWLLARGRITDLDMRVREQRVKPYLMTLVCAGLGWLGLRAGAAPALFSGVAGAGVAQLALLLAITLRWKISAHAAAAASLVALAVWLHGPAAWPLWALVPLVAWSRLRLKRHTLMQTVAGALLGSGLIALGLAWAG